MPLWRIYSSPSTFTSSQRDGLANAITDVYTRYGGLPSFYVNVLFIDLNTDHYYIGGKKRSNFVRIVVEQIARQMPNPDTPEGAKQRRGWMDRLNTILKPWIIDREDLDWEIHISETPRDLWRLQGLDAPPSFSEAEKMWKEVDKPIPWEGEQS